MNKNAYREGLFSCFASCFDRCAHLLLLAPGKALVNGIEGQLGGVLLVDVACDVMSTQKANKSERKQETLKRKER